jgi:enoyl-CoA hydratase/carnithine racemase
MAAEDRKLANGASQIDFQTDPSRYRHWMLAVDGEVATLTMDVDENGGLFEGYLLKLNSYDLGVDIELADAVQRLRFEYPQVKTVLVRSGKNRVFCAGANIRMRRGRDACAQGQLLQVHQRDAQRHRGFEREFRPAVHLRRQRHRGGRRLRARACGRSHHPGR